MKPKAFVLIITGVALGLIATGAALWASFTLPYYGNVHHVNSAGFTFIRFNFWDQPLSAETVPDGDDVVIDAGPFPRFKRNGHWTRTRIVKGVSVEQTDIWYIHGREVTREEWESR